MSPLIAKAWDEVVRPMIQRPRQLQVAALCYRKEGGRKEVLLITSRGTGRWILPKGYLMAGKSAAEAARIEAWEEAGVRPAKVSEEPVGEYTYLKRDDDGVGAPYSAQVYPIKVKQLEDDFPERGQRKRQWIAPEKAAELVAEKDLQALLRDF
ncbi:MAG: NUDIX hydrolase [Rhodobacterales bacterium]|nr:MAG: NUDIX hydrolase [Rhodobacterales bacterium]